MKTSRRLLLLAVIFGLITVLALNYHLNSIASLEPAAAQMNYVQVVTAKKTIPEHTRITAEMLQLKALPAEGVHPEALKELEEAVGGISRQEIVKGEQLLASRVSREERPAIFSYRVPEKLRAISLPVNEITGVSGFISPGDRVDVLVTYSQGEDGATTTTYTVLQNALVLAVGEHTRPSEGEERRLTGTVTLAVTPGEAEVLAYAFVTGSFHFTLRSPLDGEIVNLDYYNAQNFNTYRER